jgi:hypothetical protein
VLDALAAKVSRHAAGAPRGLRAEGRAREKVAVAVVVKQRGGQRPGAGRPRCDPEKIAAALRLVAGGASRRAAALAVGIDPGTLRRALRRALRGEEESTPAIFPAPPMSGVAEVKP